MRGKVKLSYTDLVSGKRESVKAKITREHPASSYGQPVIVLPDGALDYNSAILLDYRVDRASKRETALLAEWRRNMPPLG
jgi:hypothetical protein